jgi:DNA-binding beta-propeller fold protein YncE
VFAWRDGQLRLVAKDLTGPNGIAFSPDEQFLYVTNWDPAKKIIVRYPIAADGSLGAGELFFDIPAPRARKRSMASRSTRRATCSSRARVERGSSRPMEAISGRSRRPSCRPISPGATPTAARST